MAFLEFNDIKKIVKENNPGGKVTKVDLEGPKVVLYTDDLPFFIDSDEIKIMPPDEAKSEIEKILPDDAVVKEIVFDDYFREVIIEAEKLGLVIGRKSETLNKIIKATGWQVKLLRTPPIQSDIIDSVRKIILNSSKERQKILKSVGKQIYRKPDASCDWVRVTPLGGARQVGRSCFLIQTPESNVLLDCGINPAGSETNRFPDFRASDLAINKLDSVIISHSHLDHMGFLPYLYKYGYDGPVYCTEPTRDLMTMLQIDAVEIGEKENNELPFSSNEVKEMVKHTIPLDYEEVADITPDMRLTLYDAGHILGSSIIHLHIGDGLHNIVYTGDIKFGSTKLLEPANFRFPRVETLIMEGTYGGRYDAQPNRRDAENLLLIHLKNALSNNGKVLIPVFAVGRSQEVLMVLESFYRFNKISPEIPVYLDGMIWEATAIHTTYLEHLNERLRKRIFNGYNPFLTENFKNVKHGDREKIMKSKDPCIILATSGMMTGGPVIEYFKNFAEDEKNMLLFVGYQAEGSMGKRIQNGLVEIPIDVGGKTKSLNVKMKVETVDGFSGHADRRQLLGYAKKIDPKPKRVLVVHGESEKCMNLAMTLYSMFGFESTAPQNLDTVRLI
ncbi:MAG: hypothetical protein A7315_14045 [Candidatus Altiarchaeales archaeon WOR_SM1_79]|nr:MAG: hypothetical protein A7315_14045 [Candidatus Altiarchaeales archaeon WOR_SM1_79]